MKRITLNFSTIEKALVILTFLIVAIILALSVRGYLGNPTPDQLNTQEWGYDGPFELSPERGRYALLYSLVEAKSFYFPVDVAKFAIPDLGYFNGHYVSLFAPAVSFIAVPGYMIGKALGANQVGAFSVIALFALFNGILVYAISRELGVKKAIALIASLIFLFATPSFAYAVTFYQHHISTFLVLISVYLLIKYDNFWSLGIVWFMCALSLSVDYPNLFMMLPIGIFSIGKILVLQKDETKLKVNFKPLRILSVVFLILPMIFFFWFNKESYGNPLQLAGGVEQIKIIGEDGNPVKVNDESKPLSVEEAANKTVEEPKNVVRFFNTRAMLNGFYILFLSPDRGIISFAPIIVLGFIGFYFLYKSRSKYSALLLSILLANIVLYAMWGDPWGGWAFGARYLIPGYSILAIFIAFMLSQINKKVLLIPVLALFLYSAYINTSGALTANTNPPKVEVLALEALSGIEQKYTYKRNMDLLYANKSKSVFFNSYFNKHMKAIQYFTLVFGTISALALVLFGFAALKNEKN